MTLTDNDMNDTDEINDPGRRAASESGVVPDELIDAVMANVDAGGVELLGENGVIAELTKRILERGLSEELTEHLGYETGDAAGRGSGNNRNGTSAKTVLTEIGAVDLEIPRDRNGTFDPKLVPTHTRRLDAFNANIVHLYARGLTTRDIRRGAGPHVQRGCVTGVDLQGDRRDHRRAHRVADPPARAGVPDHVHRRPRGEGAHRRHRHQQGRLPGHWCRCGGPQTRARRVVG